MNDADRRERRRKLVLGRRVGERVVVPEIDLELTVLSVRGSQVKIGMAAPARIKVIRGELLSKFESTSTAVAAKQVTRSIAPRVATIR